MDFSGLWYNRDCFDILPFVCEFNETDFSLTTAPTTTTTIATTTEFFTTTPVHICRSYIPFSYDISKKLSYDQFATLRKFLLNSFLKAIFPIDIQPAVFSTYATNNNDVNRLGNVTDIIAYVTVVDGQDDGTDSYFTA